MTDAEFADFRRKTQAAMIGVTSCLVQTHSVVAAINAAMPAEASGPLYKELSELADRIQTLFARIEELK